MFSLKSHSFYNGSSSSLPTTRWNRQTLFCCCLGFLEIHMWHVCAWVREHFYLSIINKTKKYWVSRRRRETEDWTENSSFQIRNRVCQLHQSATSHLLLLFIHTKHFLSAGISHQASDNKNSIGRHYAPGPDCNCDASGVFDESIWTFRN